MTSFWRVLLAESYSTPPNRPALTFFSELSFEQ